MVSLPPLLLQLLLRLHPNLTRPPTAPPFAGSVLDVAVDDAHNQVPPSVLLQPPPLLLPVLLLLLLLSYVEEGWWGI